MKSVKGEFKNKDFTLAADYHSNLHSSWYACTFAKEQYIAINGERKGQNPRKYFISIRTTKEFKEVGLREAHSYWIYRIIHLPIRNLLITCSADQKIKIWKATINMEPVKTLHCSQWVRSLAVDSSERLLFSAGDHTGIYVWNLNTGRRIRCMPTDKHIGHTSMKYIPKHHLLAVGCTGSGCIWIFDVETYKMIHKLEAHAVRKAIWAMEYEPAFSLLFTGSSDGFVKIWKIDDKNSIKLQSVLPVAGGFVGQIVSIPEYQLIASTHSTNDVKFWDVFTGESKGSVETNLQKTWVLHPVRSLGRLFCFDHASDEVVVIHDQKQVQNIVAKNAKCEIF